MTSSDEDAVEDELAALIADSIKKQLPDAPTAAENPEVELPNVPEAEIGISRFILVFKFENKFFIKLV